MDTPANTFYEQVVNICSCLPKKTKSANVSREFWMPDHSCRICCDCDSQFTIFNRRHHCRICGQIFCGKCSSNSIPAPSDEPNTGGEEHWEERIRVCNYCFKQWEQETSANYDNGIQVSSPILSTSPSAIESHTNSSIAEEINRDECDTTSLYDLEGKDIESVDLENNGLLWLFPEPEDEDDDMEVVLFDDDDDDAAEGWRYQCSSSSFGDGEFRSKNRSSEELKKAMKSVVDGHFRPLVAKLLQVENLPVGEEDGNESWLEIITSLCWEAATLVKPDTSKGGGMDPGGYVKVKCVACGRRSESMVVKGVVCKKNVAHWRMASKIEKPRFLIFGGALEFQRASNSLSSIDTLSQQEIDHLKMAVAKIDAQHPNVLLIEKTVSGFAQDYLYAKDITLVLNIKRPLLESIARCTGAQIVPSIDHLSSRKLGYCDTFHVEKFLEEHGSAGQAGKKMVKTLMFFEGFPKPLDYTILLKGANGDELKKVKHVVQNGVFAAFQLAMETCFLADEGATLPELPLKSPVTIALPDKPSSTDRSISTIPGFTVPATDKALGSQTSTEPQKASNPSSTGSSMEDFSQGAPDRPSILVSLSSLCIWKGTVCEWAHIFRIQHYGSSDKPLGRFLQDHLFDQSFRCHSCEMPSEAHVHSYTHRQGTLSISVKKLPEFLLPGEREGKIWMWHRCLRCPRTDGFPPATRRVVMSDTAWSLSFGKFLELSFLNHAAASRVASCGHSLHRDCLRFYGFGKMVGCFRYESIDVHSVYLPPSKIDFKYNNQEWIEKEANEVFSRGQHLFTEIRNILHLMAEKISFKGSPNSSPNVAKSECCFVVNLEKMLPKEQAEFEECFHKALNREVKNGQPIIDILEINRLRRQLFFHSYLWDRRLVYATSLDNNFLGLSLPIKVADNIEESTTWLRMSFIDFYQSIKKNSSGSTQLDTLGAYNPVYVSSFRELERLGGVRFFLPMGVNDTVVPVYDGEITSVISFALVSPEYHVHSYHSFDETTSTAASESLRTLGPMDESISSMSGSRSSLVLDPLMCSKSLHANVSFTDDGPLGKVNYTVTCYYAKRFDALRRICCPSEVDFIRSLARCKKWEAQGGKRNVYFAKTLDDRFIIKQVTKTELESFMQFAPEYFNYLSESIVTGSPTCLAKILGIYQVTSKHQKGGKESRMDVLVMENLLFGRNVTRLYDLKGSSQSRYNPDTGGSNKVLLDQNLIEAMPTSPIFVGNKAKRLLERAVWNDTSFLESINVMDYSLLVGVDEEKHELVSGTIDFLKQYTWDKYLETWVKASGILGGPKNSTPTVISPKQYKKRFRKAMSEYFLMVPDQWSPPTFIPSGFQSDLFEENRQSGISLG